MSDIAHGYGRTECSEREAHESWISRTFYQDHVKRGVELLIALVLVPLIALVIASVWVCSFREGSFFYRHQRVGRDGKTFGCLKIRTMRIDSAERLRCLLESDACAAQEWEKTQKLKNDPRVTPLGHCLRKTSIDELPQLWNVIKGEMSLVGPRPVTPEELNRYGEQKNAYLSVRPGITGIWQINAGRNEMNYDERVELDVGYARSVSALGDLKILIGTVVWAMNPNGL